MEKAPHKLNSVKLLSGANSEPERAVTGIRTKLSQEPQNPSNRRRRRGIIIHSCKRRYVFFSEKKKKKKGRESQ